MKDQQLEQIGIEILDLSVRSYNCLKRGGIHNLGALYDALCADTLMSVRNLGRLSCEEIKTKMTAYLADGADEPQLFIRETDQPEVFAETPLSELQMSARLYNALMRAGYQTVGSILKMTKIEKYGLQNVGAQSRDELDQIISKIRDRLEIKDEEDAQGQTDDRFIQRDEDDYIVPEEFDSIPVNKLPVSTRVLNGLLKEKYTTVGDVLRMTEDEFWHLPGLGVQSRDELRNIVQIVRQKGTTFFSDVSAIDAPIDEKYKRAIDIDTVNRLKESFGFKDVWLADWYHVTRSRIGQILVSNKNRGNWLNRALTEKDTELIQQLIHSNKDTIESDDVRVFFLNNRKDDCVFLIVGDDEIKCFFLSMLPENIGNEIRKERMDCLSIEERDLIARGKIVSVLKKEYFCPDEKDKYSFRNGAKERSMSLEEYCCFLTGKEYITSQSTIDDDRLVSFLRSHFVNGQLRIPSIPSTQWFFRFLDRNGHTVDEILSLYGFSSLQEPQNEELTSLDTIEDDMLIHDTPSDSWLVKLFAENPLIGNRVLSDAEKDQIQEQAKRSVDLYLSKEAVAFSLKDSMRVALAVITYAKEWDTKDGQFWSFITAQFGYRDESNKLRGFLCDCVYKALYENGRLFIITDSGFQYKSTIVTHALTTKRSWMRFFDFLFDFYKTNMNWTFLENDPIISRMLISLRNKLSASGELEEKDIEISTVVYFFQEGIQKLIIHRPGYAKKLISRILARISGLLSHAEVPAASYLDILCDGWFENKLKNAREEGKRSRSPDTTREIAVDYTKIHPVYSLQNENHISICLPDVRLRKTEFSEIKLEVLVGDRPVEEKRLNYYGNELGKTLIGFDINVNRCIGRGDGSFHLRIIITCDDETIYDSKDALYRDLLCFSKGRETDVGRCSKGAYYLFVPNDQQLQFVNSELSEIDAVNGWKSYFVRLNEGFAIRHNGKIAAFDESGVLSSGFEIQVLYPQSFLQAVFSQSGCSYEIVAEKPHIDVIAKNRIQLQKYAFLMNDKRINAAGCIHSETDAGSLYSIPLQMDALDVCRFQLLDLSKDTILAKRDYKYLADFSVRFNRDFYCSESDYENAAVMISSRFGTVRRSFTSRDSILYAEMDGGTVEIPVPTVAIRFDTNDAWPFGKLFWTGEIRQEFKLRVSCPDSCAVALKLNDIGIPEESPGCFALGNSVYGLSSVGNDIVNIMLTVSKNAVAESYCIGQLTKVERFISDVRFEYRDNTLYWNRGEGFAGSKNEKIRLRVHTPDEDREFPLNLESETVQKDIDLPDGEYSYTIVKDAGSLFRRLETVLFKGSLIIGDINTIRFLGKTIRITNVTYENDEVARSVELRNTYIDRIEYLGIRFVDSEERDCPVYRGTMFFMGKDQKRHEYSFDKGTFADYKTYKVNPVQIIFINAHTLSITDEDGDGLYYYRYFNRETFEDAYSVTDREPMAYNRNNYYLADLYIYQ